MGFDDDEKFPTWDGRPEAFQDYKTSVELLVDETKKENREYLGPKLARRLTGNAWDNVESIERDKLKQEDGVSYLLGFLESSMTGTQGQNMGSRIMGYFVHHHRKAGQSPQDYMTVDARVRKDMYKSLLQQVKSTSPMRQ